MNRQLNFNAPFKRAEKTFFRIREALLPGQKRLIIFVILVIFCLASSCSVKPQSSLEEPVEPLVTGKEALRGEPLLRGRFSIPNPDMKVFALSVSSDGEDILFSSEARTISMLDNEGNLRWEITSEGLPVCASLTEDGRFAAVGTDKGTVFSARRRSYSLAVSFEDKIEHIVLNKNGDKHPFSFRRKEQHSLLPGPVGHYSLGNENRLVTRALFHRWRRNLLSGKRKIREQFKSCQGRRIDLGERCSFGNVFCRGRLFWSLRWC